MMHKDVRKMTVTGQMVDTNVERHKNEMVKALYDILRDDGHIPLLDIDPQFTVDYDFEQDCRVFTLSVFGIEGDNPWEYSGVLSGRPIRKSTPSHKSQQS